MNPRVSTRFSLGMENELAFVVSRIQRIDCQPEKLLYTAAIPARGLLNRKKKSGLTLVIVGHSRCG